MVVDRPIPTQLLAPTPTPPVEYPYTGSTAGELLIDYDDALRSCNADKTAIRRLRSLEEKSK